MAGLTSVPNMEGPIPRLKGKKIRRLAAYRGSLQWASTGGAGLAIIFRFDPESETPKKVQRFDAYSIRGLLEAAFYAQGWATVWSRRSPSDEQVLRDFYRLNDNEEILGWLFVGRPAHNSVPDRAINLPRRTSRSPTCRNRPYEGRHPQPGRHTLRRRRGPRVHNARPAARLIALVESSADYSDMLRMMAITRRIST